jgi:hypothetical protein
MLKIAMVSVVAKEPEMSVDRAMARAKTAEILGILITLDALGMLPPRKKELSEELSEALSFAITTSSALDKVRDIADMQISHIMPVNDDLHQWAKDMANMVNSILEMESNAQKDRKKK